MISFNLILKNYILEMNKKKILYIGNKLSKHGFTPTTIETLGEKLKDISKFIKFDKK